MILGCGKNAADVLNFIISLEEGVVLIGCAGGSLTGADKKLNMQEWRNGRRSRLKICRG